MGEEKKGGCSGIIWLVVLAVGGYILISNLLSPPPTELQKLQMDPEAALKHYLQTTHKFKQDPFRKGGQSADVFDCLPKKDLDWFEQNYKTYDSDPFDLGSGINPADADTLARVKALRSLITGGPTREDCEILNKKVEGTKATFEVKQYSYKTVDGDPIYRNYKIELIMEGKYWKVKDFGGGRD